MTGQSSQTTSVAAGTEAELAAVCAGNLEGLLGEGRKS